MNVLQYPIYPICVEYQIRGRRGQHGDDDYEDDDGDDEMPNSIWQSGGAAWNRTWCRRDDYLVRPRVRGRILFTANQSLFTNVLMTGSEHTH